MIRDFVQVLLSHEQALEIYRLRPLDNSSSAKPTSSDVAEMYGVSPKTIRYVPSPCKTMLVLEKIQLFI